MEQNYEQICQTIGDLYLKANFELLKTRELLKLNNIKNQELQKQNKDLQDKINGLSTSRASD